MQQPFQIIQGGMGVGVSGWPLARAVSLQGQLGVVSGTGLGIVLLRRLQKGDPDGHCRRAIDHFPWPAMAKRIWDRYYVPGGVADGAPWALSPLPLQDFSIHLQELTVLGNFVEVFLAKEGHTRPVGINYLEKLQICTLPSLYGVMLAGVDYVLMGAGIPRWIPGALDALAQHQPAEIRLDLEGAASDDIAYLRFDPQKLTESPLPPLHRPTFLAIVASATLAMTLARKSNGRVDGFVIESPIAGGHNAPPRGPLHLNAAGEPIYGERDVVDLDTIRSLGLPFWLAGGYGSPEKLAEARAAGAAGVQVGTAFAFCAESALRPDIKQAAIAQALAGTTKVRTDPCASPTGFPFKVMAIEGSLSDPAVYARRPRVCDLGYMRRAYRRADGTLGYRCSAEPVADFVAKGGAIEQTTGRMCLCNGLFAAVGYGQRDGRGGVEVPLVTAGDDVASLAQYLPPGQTSYTAADVLAYLLGPARQSPSRQADSASMAVR